MAITDRTKKLDKAWAEFEVVAFTAGSIPDIDAAVTEVEAKLKRGTLSGTSSPTLASVKKWISRAKQELLQVKSFTFSRRYAYATINTDEYRIALPPDYNGGSFVVRDQENDRTIKVLPKDKFDLKYPDVDEEDNDEPMYCCIKNRELWICPPTNADIKVELEYDRSGEDNIATDLSFLPEIERFRCCDYAIYEAAESLEDWEKAKWYRSKWGDGLGRSVKANARRRWSNMGYRAISMFEEAGVRGHQN